jgi:hypothetical protein
VALVSMPRQISNQQPRADGEDVGSDVFYNEVDVRFFCPPFSGSGDGDSSLLLLPTLFHRVVFYCAPDGVGGGSFLFRSSVVGSLAAANDSSPSFLCRRSVDACSSFTVHLRGGSRRQILRLHLRLASLTEVEGGSESACVHAPAGVSAVGDGKMMLSWVWV